MEVAPAQRKTTSLVSLKDEAKAMKDESKAVKDEADRLAGSNKMLQQRFSAGALVALFMLAVAGRIFRVADCLAFPNAHFSAVPALSSPPKPSYVFVPT